VLFAIAAVAAVCLGVVYEVTKGPIAAEQARATAAAMAELLPQAKDFDEQDMPLTGAISAVTVGYYSEGVAGVIVKVAPKGFSDKIEMLVAIRDGAVAGIKIVKQTETPGLGANAAGKEFGARFVGKRGQLAVTKSDSTAENEIQAITSATITTRAVVDGVNEALAFYNSNF
jgi:electron transport complex protein RnfG